MASGEPFRCAERSEPRRRPCLTAPGTIRKLPHRCAMREGPVTELERFFRRLVANLAATDPAGSTGPIPLDDIHRRHRALPRPTAAPSLLDTSEDYELVLLRLCAGEGGLVRTEPEEARARFARGGWRAPTPTSTCSTQFENVLMTIRSEPLARGPLPSPSRVRAAGLGAPAATRARARLASRPASSTT